MYHVLRLLSFTRSHFLFTGEETTEGRWVEEKDLR